jgi:phospholipase C
MDGAAAMQGGYAYNTGPVAPNATVVDAAGQRALGYYTEADLPFYYWAATQFGTSNRWFSAAPARTQINRMYLLAATSQGHVQPNSATDVWNVTAKTIFESLQNAGVTWKVYVTDFNAATPSSGSYMDAFYQFTPKYQANFVDAKTFATDAAAGTLPQVSLIESGYESSTSDTGSEVDEHPQANVQVGAAYVQSMVTALMNGPNWKDSVFFLTYDEFGGLYDHVPPMQTVNPDGIAPIDLPAGNPAGDFTISGLRVPLVVISPFTKPHFVSNTPADFTAMLKFIETRFSLQPLTKRDAAQPDMTEFFDWSSPSLNPGAPPTQPTNGACYYNAVP